jgi:hypothetical protein
MMNPFRVTIGTLADGAFNVQFWYETDCRFNVTCDTVDYAAIWHWLKGKSYKTRLITF